MEIDPVSPASHRGKSMANIDLPKLSFTVPGHPEVDCESLNLWISNNYDKSKNVKLKEIWTRIKDYHQHGSGPSRDERQISILNDDVRKRGVDLEKAVAMKLRSHLAEKIVAAAAADAKLAKGPTEHMEFTLMVACLKWNRLLRKERVINWRVVLELKHHPAQQMAGGARVKRRMQQVGGGAGWVKREIDGEDAANDGRPVWTRKDRRQVRQMRQMTEMFKSL
jgi:hypothetical protein